MSAPSAHVFQIPELRHLILAHLCASPADLLSLTAVSTTFRQHILASSPCRRALYLDALPPGLVEPDPAAKLIWLPAYIPSRRSCEYHQNESGAVLTTFPHPPPGALDAGVRVEVMLNPLLRSHFPELVFVWNPHSMVLLLNRPLPLGNDDPRLRREASCREMLLTQPPIRSVEVCDSGNRRWSVGDEVGLRMGRVLDGIVEAQERRGRVGVYI